MVRETTTQQNRHAELTDRVIEETRKGLADNLGWLDNAFGRAERLVKYDTTMRRIYTPNIHTVGNEYISVAPDANIGNFCFFWLDDPQEVLYEPGISASVKTTFSVIFWFDYRTVLNDDIRNRDAVKHQILDVLNGGILIRQGYIKISKIYELAENIYKGFSLDEIGNQFLMHPYGGFRFEGIMRAEGICIE